MNRVNSGEEIAKKLRELRGDRVRTATARKMGISYSALCKYENGEKIPNDSTKAIIANFYGVTVQSIFFD